jgi:hypothetical protein
MELEVDTWLRRLFEFLSQSTSPSSTFHIISRISPCKR